MILEIDDDWTDEVVAASLAKDYVSLSENLKDPEMCWHEDDVQSWKETLPAIKTVLAWYCVDVDAEIKRAKKMSKKK